MSNQSQLSTALKGFLQLVRAGAEHILLNQTQNQTQQHCQRAAAPESWAAGRVRIWERYTGLLETEQRGQATLKDIMKYKLRQSTAAANQRVPSVSAEWGPAGMARLKQQQCSPTAQGRAHQAGPGCTNLPAERADLPATEGWGGAGIFGKSSGILKDRTSKQRAETWLWKLIHPGSTSAWSPAR